MANPLLSELLSMTLPADRQPSTKVEYAGQVWEFRTMIPERVENWRDTKVPLGTLGTAAAITGHPAAEIVSALVAINGKPTSAYVSDDLDATLAPVKDALKKSQRAISDEEMNWLLDATTMDLMYTFLTGTYPRDFIMGLYEKYVSEVRDPARKRYEDFFGSSQETSGTPASPPNIEES